MFANNHLTYLLFQQKVLALAILILGQ